jgi:hypothetical protein
MGCYKDLPVLEMEDIQGYNQGPEEKVLVLEQLAVLF